MQIEQRTTFIHADDFGITPGQAKAILSLSSSCGGSGALNSVSIFANSPAFYEAASLAQPYVRRGVLRVCLHLNLVEGPSVADPKRIPLLVNERGMFDNNFMGLFKLAAVKSSVFYQRFPINSYRFNWTATSMSMPSLSSTEHSRRL